MEEEIVHDNLLSASYLEGVKIIDEEEDFRSCCEEEDDLEEGKGSNCVCSNDEFSVKMYFKGISASPPGESASGLSGIGVVMERPADCSPIQVQKRIDFFVKESVVAYLALMDGLIEAKKNKVTKIFAFTDCELLYDQIKHNERLDDPLLFALRERILEHTSCLEKFTLDLVTLNDLQGALKLAQVAVGLISFPVMENESTESCSICCEEKLASMMITMKCSHRFCSHCMKAYVDGKIESGQVPVKCPQHECVYCLSTSECRAFLPVNSYGLLEKALKEAMVLQLDAFCCPYPDCSVLLYPRECSSSTRSSPNHTESSCMECPVCQRLICTECEVPWHTSMTCEEYQNLTCDILQHPVEERLRSCKQCGRKFELSRDCYDMTCWDDEQRCECAFPEEATSEDGEGDSTHEYVQWSWDSFDSLPLMMNAYSDQEQSQLALVQRFLAGGFSLTDLVDCQPPPSCADTYVDLMKDLHQLPWLERFVSVISDNYDEEYI